MPLQLKTSHPRIALNKAYLRQSVAQADASRLQAQTSILLDRLAEVGLTESEEHIKNLFGTFLKQVWFQDYYVNTSGRIDLAINSGPSPKDPIGVIFEAKRPGSTEFPTPQKPNTKALQELLLYYLREREAGNNQIRHLVITNGWVWYIIDENWFDRLAWQDKKLLADFKRYEADKRTEEFYKDVAAPFFDSLTEELPATYLDLRTYQQVLENPDLFEPLHQEEQQEVATLYKILSPQHLLRLAVVNDSNTLNQAFYGELLHIMGLEEAMVNKKMIIRRLAAGKRHDGSLLELVIFQLEHRNRLKNIAHQFYPELHGDEKLFAIAIELVITWVNRILFLKLLEGQLVTIHKTQYPDDRFKFLSTAQVRDFDELAKLFFDVLACKPEDRHPRIQQRFEHVPYLNSSLFEETPLESNVLPVSQIDDHTPLRYFGTTVLKDRNGKRLSGEGNTLNYLFRFLDAYDFGSDSTGEIRPDAKTLINAAVLGLIFEKINGYKEGSVYTPGYITMYMCRETIREALVKKFNDTYGWQAETFDDLGNYLTERNQKSILAYNGVVNSLKICDPAVGSGHFLVSALNEMIACKSELGILADNSGKLLKGWRATVENDELLLLDDEGKLFNYAKLGSGIIADEFTRLQQTLFLEKQTLIENSLFGVDINPNSVKICRLRLWIELLKNAYYTPESRYKELETLPNIDINIKTGNSLLSRFSLTEDLSDVFRSQRFSLSTYRDAVRAYKQTNTSNAKDELVNFIREIKEQFKQSISNRDPRRKKLSELRGQLALTDLVKDLFGNNLWPSEKSRQEEKKRIEGEIQKLVNDLDDTVNNKLYTKSFEWRFEFPEVLDDEGNFAGFDVLVANPPYIRQEELGELKTVLQQKFSVFTGTADIYQYFFELGNNLIRQDRGVVNYVVANKWMLAGYGEALRRYMQGKTVHRLIDFGDLPVFDHATAYPCVIRYSPSAPSDDHQFPYCRVNTLKFETNLTDYVALNERLVTQSHLKTEGWNLSDQPTVALLEKLKSKGRPLGEYVDGKIYRGVLTGFNEAFVIDTETKDRLIAQDPKSASIIKPFLAGRDIKRYQQPASDRWLIYFLHGWTNKQTKQVDKEAWLSKKYPAIYQHLLPYREQAIKRTDQGQYWWELRACSYVNEFEKPKIIYQVFQVTPCFVLDTNKMYCNNSIWIIPDADIKLLAILNSSLGWFMISNYCTQIQNGYQLIYDYFSKVTITGKKAGRSLTSKVTKIMALKQDNADTSKLEAEIDQLVYELYDLTPEEIKLVERQTKP